MTRNKKTTWNRRTRRQTNKTTTPDHTVKLFASTVTATRVFHRPMPEFKNCEAMCWLLIDEVGGRYTFANSYNGPTPKASFDPSHYSYELTEKAQKLLDKKMDLFTEIEVMEWPQWIVPAKRGRRSR